MAGMLCGFATELYLWLGTHVAWTWWVLIGTVVTFLVGWLSSLAFTSNRQELYASSGKSGGL
jgi:hypothetical protein